MIRFRLPWSGKARMFNRTEDRNPNYRVIIYGPGAIGGTVGGHLALSGSSVVLIGRGGHIARIQEQGLHLITPIGTHTLKIPAVTSPEQIEFTPDDVVLLCVKSQDTQAALRDLQTVIQDIPVFCLQNSVSNEAIAASYFPRVYGAMVRIGGEYVKDGEITTRRDPPGWLIIGNYPKGADSRAGSVAVQLRKAGFHVLVTPDVMPYKWGKLVANLSNAIGAITNGKWDEVKLIAAATQDEAKSIISQAGIYWVSQEELEKQWSEMTARPRHVITTESQSSTWQSLARQQGTVETEFLNGEIVRLARRLGQKAPINEALVRISHEMAKKREGPGRYSARELTKMLGLG
jgi:2-dehydropantoate 2-reductase